MARQENAPLLKTYQAFLSSPFFVLQANNSSTPYHVHQGLLSSISPVLSAACSNGMHETGERRMKFKDVPEAVLISFLQWAYTGGYVDCNDGRWAEAPTGVICKTSLDEVAEAELPGEESGNRGMEERATATADGLPANEDRAHPLLLHVRLYVFADKFLVHALQELATSKIKDQLKGLETRLDGHELEAVLDLLEYAFENAHEDDSLLDWLGAYAAWKLGELKQQPGRFARLLQGSSGSFVRHIIRRVPQSSSNPWDMKDVQLRGRYVKATSRNAMQLPDHVSYK